MKLLAIELENWGPYRRKNRLELDVAASSPVILIHGENMRGKTSLLRGIVWCLYGQLKTQDGKNLELVKIINRPELRQHGETEFGVRLKFSHEGRIYDLHRHGKASMSAAGQVHVTGIAVSLLPEGGDPVATEAISDQINSILDYEVADFFFFDGEMLSRFDERLRDEGSTARGFVRNQIERALGLPFLKSLVTDLSEIQDDISKDIQKSLRLDTKAKKAVDDYNASSVALESARSDLDFLVSRQSEIEEQLSEIEQQLSASEELKAKFFEQRSWESKLEDASETIKDIEQQTRTYLEDNWWFPLASQLSERRAEAASRMQDSVEIERNRARLGLRLEDARAKLSETTCRTCGQSLPKQAEEHIHDEIAALEHQLDEFGSALDSDAMRRDFTMADGFAGAQSVHARVVDLSRDHGRSRLKRRKAQQKIQEIDEDLQTNEIDFASLESQRASLRQKSFDGKSLVTRAQDVLQKKRQENQALAQAMRKNPRVAPRDGRKLDYVGFAHEVVRESIAEFSAIMRQSVESAATDLFSRLTTEPLYSGVAISPDYTLRVLNDNGDPVDLISAGGNQVMTMSFIGALAQCSASDAPMVMDTPFGRLDTGHRKSILNWIGELNTQTILFVQSGEYNASRDRSLLGDRVGREYQIKRVSEEESVFEIGGP